MQHFCWYAQIPPWGVLY